MLPREDLLKRVENKAEITRVIDKAEQAIKNWESSRERFSVSSRTSRSIESIFQNLTQIVRFTLGWLSSSRKTACCPISPRSSFG